MARHDIRGLKLSDGTYVFSSKDVYNLNDNFIQLSQEVFGNSNFSKDLGKQVKKNTASIEAITSTVGDLEADYTQVIQDVDNLSLAVVAADGRALNAQLTADNAVLSFQNQKIGGRNLIKQRSNVFTSSTMTANDDSSHNITQGYSVPEWGATDAVRILMSSGSGAVMLKGFKNLTSVTDTVVGQEYVVSIYVKNLRDVSMRVTINGLQGSPSDIVEANQSKRIVIKGVRNSNNLQIQFSAYGIGYYIDCVVWRDQVEHGNVVTDWTYAPEDTDAKLNTTTHTLDANGYTLRDANNETLISPQGMANEQNIGRADNVEDGYPLKIPFYIGDNVNVISQAVIQWEHSKFRTYSKGAASGGGTKTTPSGGAGTTGARWGATGIAIGTTGTTASTGLPHNHTISLDDLSHSHSTPSHTHSLDITHSHDPVFGILETNIPSTAIEIYVDGVLRASRNATRGTVDLSAFLTTNGWHVVEVRSTTIKRLDVNVFLKTYIRR